MTAEDVIKQILTSNNVESNDNSDGLRDKTLSP